MGIQPSSDLILDVVRAADPQRSQAMASRLKQAGGPGGIGDDGGAGFDDAFSEVRKPRPTGMSSITAGSSLALRNASALSEKRADRLAADDPYRRFEAMVLSNFVSTMMPSKANNVFGSGTAGSVWRSMLAERVATEVAKAGGIGIAERIAPRDRVRDTPDAVADKTRKI